ncbi:MAG: hypothetical protein ABS35_37460 [Kaistia sp. SCN 65-12]|nr:MAG: hypothetical protein ABS35_37460 [Kaistia sp. SCN 65-12]
MIRVKMHAAKTNLSRLVAEAQAGEEVVLMRGGDTVARIVPLAPVAAGAAPVPRRPGRLGGRIDFDDRFFEPFPEPESARWDH